MMVPIKVRRKGPTKTRLRVMRYYPPMAVEELWEIGARLYGKKRRWRAPLARALGLDPRQVYRYCDRELDIPMGFAISLRLLDAAWASGPVAWQKACNRLTMERLP